MKGYKCAWQTATLKKNSANKLIEYTAHESSSVTASPSNKSRTPTDKKQFAGELEQQEPTWLRRSGGKQWFRRTQTKKTLKTLVCSKLTKCFEDNDTSPDFSSVLYFRIRKRPKMSAVFPSICLVAWLGCFSHPLYIFSENLGQELVCFIAVDDFI